MNIFFLFICMKIHIKCSESNDIKDYDAEKILNEQKLSDENSFLNISDDDFDEYLEFFDRDEFSISNKKTSSATITDNFDDLRIDKFDEYVKELYIEINSYIKINIPVNQLDVYMERLDLSFKTFQECTTNNEELFLTDIDKDYTFVLNCLVSEFKNQAEITNENYKKFSCNLDQKLNEVYYNHREKYKELYDKLYVRSNSYLFEFMKIYKYIKVFPELLCLGYVTRHNCFENITIFLHLKALFLVQNEENLVENRIIVLFLWMKTLSYTKKRNMDFISIFELQGSKSLDISQCYFFNFEFIRNQRRKIIRRKDYYNDQNQSICEDDRIHYNVVLRLFLFQHLIYLKHANVKNCEFEEFKAFCKGVLEGEGCYRSNFYQFLAMIKNVKMTL